MLQDRRFVLAGCLLLSLVVAGCAKPDPVAFQADTLYLNVAPDQAGRPAAGTLAEPPAEIQLECRSANRLGCRVKGRVYPWNAWVEKMGYSSSLYAVRGVSKKGNRATVVVIRR